MNIYKKVEQRFKQKVRKYIRKILLWPTFLFKKRIFQYRDCRVFVETNSVYEYERVRGSFETYALDCFFQNGLDKRTDVYYEIGSCNSIASLIMSKYLSRERITVVSFEPEANNICATTKNFCLNNIINAVLIPIALSEQNGISVLHFDNRHVKPGQGGHSLSLDFNRGSLLVPVLKLDSVIEMLKLPFPTLISIDVEGYEEAVLKGMEKLLAGKNKIVKMLVVEINRMRSPQSSNVVNLMKNYAYVLKSYKPSPEYAKPYCLACFIPK